MWRKLAGALAAISLTLGVATAGLWARSYWWEDALSVSAGIGVRVWSGQGRLVWAIDPHWSRYPRIGHFSSRSDRDRGIRFSFACGWVDTANITAPPWWEWQALFPHWAALAALSAPPVVGAWRRQRRPIDPTQCQTCGYDLCGSTGPTIRGCPECGANAGSADASASPGGRGGG